MTEYKQLTSGGTSCATLLVVAHLIKPYYARMTLELAQARQMACSQPVSTALPTNLATIEPVTRHFRALTRGIMRAGPVSESDFFTWEALICGPKDTPFVSRHPARWLSPRTCSLPFFLKISISLSGRRCICSQTDIRAPASMLIPRHPYTVNFIFYFPFLPSFLRSSFCYYRSHRTTRYPHSR